MATPTQLLVSGRNWAKTGTYSNGSWDLPIANVADSRPSIVARSTDATTGSTQFALITIAGNNAADFHLANVFQVLAAPCWPVDNPTGGVNNWNETTLTGGYLDLTYYALNMPRFFLLPATVSARYVSVAIDDHLNSVPTEIGCFGVSDFVTRLEKTGIYGNQSNAPSFANSFTSYYNLSLQVDEL
jgi:hypothetical protein